MAFINWDSKLETGIETIDFQHQSLVSKINQLDESSAEPSSDTQNMIVQFFLTELIAYTKYHFDYEEQLMKDSNYPGYVKHKAEHEAVKQVIENLNIRFESGDDKVKQEVLILLKNWIVNHILVTDKDYIPSVIKLENKY
jgi:hemerythrin